MLKLPLDVITSVMDTARAPAGRLTTILLMMSFLVTVKTDADVASSVNTLETIPALIDASSKHPLTLNGLLQVKIVGVTSTLLTVFKSTLNVGAALSALLICRSPPSL